MPADRKTFVLAHGAWHGGWCWERVAARLHGHRVYTPSYTGMGERAHLMSAGITMTTFVDDLVRLIEGEDLRVGIAAKLQGHQGEKDGLARTCRTDDQRMADIADVKGKPERGASLGLAKEQGGRPEVLIPFRPRPHR